MYSVMQSDVNSFCGDVVSEKYEFRDEDNILDQMYIEHYFNFL